MAVVEESDFGGVEVTILPTLNEIRQQWPTLRKTEDGIRTMERWMVAAVRIELIDAAKFNEMDEAVKKARLEL